MGRGLLVLEPFREGVLSRHVTGGVVPARALVTDERTILIDGVERHTLPASVTFCLHDLAFLCGVLSHS
jgi:hypothetical protein